MAWPAAKAVSRLELPGQQIGGFPLGEGGLGKVQQKIAATFTYPYGAPISKEELIEYRKKLFVKLDGILIAKGGDYNGAQQESGDTLFNLRVAAMLGIVPTPETGILVRLSDKLMRLCSLLRPNATQHVKDESIEDTIGDAINYLSYVGAMLAKKAGRL